MSKRLYRRSKQSNLKFRRRRRGLKQSRLRFRRKSGEWQSWKEKWKRRIRISSHLSRRRRIFLSCSQKRLLLLNRWTRVECMVVLMRLQFSAGRVWISCTRRVRRHSTSWSSPRLSGIWVVILTAFDSLWVMGTSHLRLEHKFSTTHLSSLRTDPSKPSRWEQQMVVMFAIFNSVMLKAHSSTRSKEVTPAPGTRLPLSKERHSSDSKRLTMNIICAPSVSRQWSKWFDMRWPWAAMLLFLTEHLLKSVVTSADSLIY